MNVEAIVTDILGERPGPNQHTDAHLGLGFKRTALAAGLRESAGGEELRHLHKRLHENQNDLGTLDVVQALNKLQAGQDAILKTVQTLQNQQQTLQNQQQTLQNQQQTLQNQLQNGLNAVRLDLIRERNRNVLDDEDVTLPPRTDGANGPVFEGLLTKMSVARLSGQELSSILTAYEQHVPPLVEDRRTAVRAYLGLRRVRVE